MTTKHRVTIDFYFEAENENDATAIADNIAEYVETANEYNKEALTPHTLDSDIEAQVGMVAEVCPHCLVELEGKMFDIDGTNLQEHFVCPSCDYGHPALT